MRFDQYLASLPDVASRSPRELKQLRVTARRSGQVVPLLDTAEGRVRATELVASLEAARGKPLTLSTTTWPTAVSELAAATATGRSAAWQKLVAEGITEPAKAAKAPTDPTSR